MINTYISASQIKTYMSCPRLWAFEKLQGVKKETTRATAAGKVVHDLIEKYLRDNIIPDQAQIYRHDKQSGVYYVGRVALSMLNHNVMKGLKYENYVEKEFKFHDIDLECKLVGFIDFYYLVNDTAFIVDHKTSTDPQAWGVKQEELDYDVQRILYCHAVALLHPEINNFEFTLNYGSIKGQITKNYGVKLRRSREEINTDYQALKPIIKEMVSLYKNKPDPKQVTYNIDACGLYGGCHCKSLCTLTSQERARGLFMEQSSVEKLLAKARARAEGKTETETEPEEKQKVQLTPPDEIEETETQKTEPEGTKKEGAGAQEGNKGSSLLEKLKKKKSTVKTEAKAVEEVKEAKTEAKAVEEVESEPEAVEVVREVEEVKEVKEVNEVKKEVETLDNEDDSVYTLTESGQIKVLSTKLDKLYYFALGLTADLPGQQELVTRIYKGME